MCQFVFEFKILRLFYGKLRKNYLNGPRNMPNVKKIAKKPTHCII